MYDFDVRLREELSADDAAAEEVLYVEFSSILQAIIDNQALVKINNMLWALI